MPMGRRGREFVQEKPEGTVGSFREGLKRGGNVQKKIVAKAQGAGD